MSPCTCTILATSSARSRYRPAQYTASAIRAKSTVVLLLVADARRSGADPAGTRGSGPVGARSLGADTQATAGTPGPSASARAASTIQVSLLPPPWDELTIRDPGSRATLVSPPGVTYAPSGPSNVKGRRSTWRGATVPSHSAGMVDNDKTGWATQFGGCCSMRWATTASASAPAAGPMTMP